MRKEGGPKHNCEESALGDEEGEQQQDERRHSVHSRAGQPTIQNTVFPGSRLAGTAARIANGPASPLFFVDLNDGLLENAAK